MLLVLIVLTIYRDKFEKKISSSYEPSKLHFGRAILTPLVYVSFTVMMILEQSMGSFLVATVFQLGYFYFYYDEAMLLLMGTRPSEDQSIALFTERGDINISVTNFMAVIGMDAQTKRKDIIPQTKIKCFGAGQAIREFV